jgi:hypothetical protein
MGRKRDAPMRRVREAGTHCQKERLQSGMVRRVPEDLPVTRVAAVQSGTDEVIHEIYDDPQHI